MAKIHSFTHTVSAGNAATKSAAKTAFVSVFAMATVALFAFQPSFVVTFGLAALVSAAMAMLAVSAVDGSTALLRGTIRALSPVFAGLLLWSAILAGTGFDSVAVSIAVAALVLPVAVIGEAVVSVFATMAIARAKDQFGDTAAAVLMADKYSGFFGEID